MLLNDGKGSFGMFSRAGRNSAEKYHILMRKDEILNGLNKKIKLPDIFTPDDNIKLQIENQDDDIDIFSSENEGDKQKNEFKPNIQKQKKVTKPMKPKDEITKYLEMKKKNKNKMENPPCTKYNPKNEYIWKRVITGPQWNQSVRKNHSVQPKVEDEPKFYLSHSEWRVDGKNFIDMARQTKRASFIASSNRKARNSNSASPSRSNLEKDPSKSASVFYQNTFYNQSNTNNILQMNNTQSSADEAAKKGNKKGSTKSLSNLMYTNATNNGGGGRKWVKVQAPDFKKVISRDQLDKIYGDKRTIIPFSIPNFKWTRSRPIVLVKYDKSIHRKKNNRPATSENGVNPNFDPHKLLDKINNFKKPKTPNFDLMTSRPEGNDSLPAYMKQIFSKQAANMITDKTLQMNNFAEGKFAQTFTSFWPKKSFNKIVNLNLLNSSKFIENVGLKNDQEGNQGHLNEINNYIQKSMKFYSKYLF